MMKRLNEWAGRVLEFLFVDNFNLFILIMLFLCIALLVGLFTFPFLNNA